MKQTSHSFKGLVALLFLASISIQAQVGINTTSPLAMLHVVETTDANGPVYSQITATNSTWSAVEGFNPNTAGGAGMIAGGTIGVLGQGGVGTYGIGQFAVLGEPVDIATDWAGYFAGDINSDQDIYYIGALIDLSDGRFKTNVRAMDNALSKIQQLRPVIYDKAIDKKDLDINISSEMEIMATGKRAPINITNEYGLIAQEVEQVIPELVKEKPVKLENSNMSSMKGVDYVGLVPILVKAVQEQQAMIDAQQKRIQQLEDKLDANKD